MAQALSSGSIMNREPSPLEVRLRRALAGTSEVAPRPIYSDIDLPLRMRKFLTPALLRALRPAAVLVPVIRRGDALSVLLTVRSEQMRSHKGQISFPGGRRDATDASAAANALREAHEEVGIEPASVEVIGYLDDYPTITRYRVTPVVGIIDGEPRIDLHAHEVAEVFEAPLAWLVDPASFERKSLLLEGLKVPIFELNHGRYRIWGATAGMLWNLCGKLQATP
jgi:8-oxo-dGTP pyrophosphatase MutT (NUDIX family)